MRSESGGHFGQPYAIKGCLPFSSCSLGLVYVMGQLDSRDIMLLVSQFTKDAVEVCKQAMKDLKGQETTS